MEILPLIIQLASGALGGNGAASLMKESSLGTLGNSLAGIVGGGLVGQLLPMLGMASSSGAMDITSILSSVVGGGVGGGALMAVIGIVKKMMAGNK